MDEKTIPEVHCHQKNIFLDPTHKTGNVGDEVTHMHRSNIDAEVIYFPVYFTNTLKKHDPENCKQRLTNLTVKLNYISRCGLSTSVICHAHIETARKPDLEQLAVCQYCEVNIEQRSRKQLRRIRIGTEILHASSSNVK